ncbi:hypothetical protein [Glycomyces albidus]|uniref:Uncharacterized protein n=1 Tax=Glycomyces albidus TaxID=2656774 RepID=A0A6L5GF72_9ACTN|nr:hypothetical protein [Glycomyces albidus]MQM28317.1 hypothetical protein [Glycomyces albidus]
MLLLSETSHAQPGATTREPAFGVYRHIAPVFAQLRGTTLPVAVLTTAPSTVNTIDNTTDMGVVTLRGRGRAVAGLGWQPVSGSKKRHGVTRGRPPREPHRLGLQEKARLGPLEAANPATGIAAFLFGVKRQVAARQ